MPEYRYARGRIPESVRFITEEMREFDQEYAAVALPEYGRDKKLQKLMDRTVENILTALIEVCGAIVTEEGLGGDTYSDVLRGCGKVLGLTPEEQEELARLGLQRNRLAHRYLNFRWQAIALYSRDRSLIVRLLRLIMTREAG